MVLEKDGVSLSKRPQFFKVLLLNPSSNLRIPANFRAHLPSELTNTATLLCPHGMSWYVGIHQSGADIFFQRGWSEFVKAHDLLIGYFLVFRYNDSMIFEVEVFDTTCCLKEYPPKQCTRLVPSVIEIENTSESDDTTLISEESDGETHGWAKSVGGETNSAIAGVQMKKTINPAQCFYSFEQFEKILTPSMVQLGMINIPKAFCVKNDLTTNRTIILKRKIEGNGEVLPMEWHVGFFFGPTESNIRNGWTKFSKENNLKIGERCVFQLISKNTFVVSVSKNWRKILSKKNQRSRMRGATINEKEGEISITVRPYHLASMHVPVSFLRGNNLMWRPSVILRDLERKEWDVRLSFDGRFVGAGWRKFTIENGLRAGDKCLFKGVTENIVHVQVVQSKV